MNRKQNHPGPQDISPTALIKGMVRPLEPIATGLTATGRPTAPLRAVLFDIYGTLLISASGDIGSQGEDPPEPPMAHPQVKALLQRLGLTADANDLYGCYAEAVQEEHARRKNEGIDYPEVRIDEIWAKILGLDDPAEARAFALVYEMAANPVWPMPGAEDLLRLIVENNRPAGIISNAQFYTRLILEYFLGRPPETAWACPDLIFYSYCSGYAKPSPKLFEKAVQALARRGINPGNTLYVGNDMRKDIAPAREKGFQTALFAGDARSLRLRSEDNGVNQIQPDLVITDLKQLEPCLFKL